MFTKTFIKTRWGNIVPLPLQCPICGRTMSKFNTSIDEEEKRDPDCWHRTMYVQIVKVIYKCDLCDTKVEVNTNVAEHEYRVEEL